MGKGVLLGILVLGAALAGCGDDSDDSTSGADAGPTAGTGGSGATGGSGGSGGSGGNVDSDGGADASSMVMCNDTIEAEPSCGGVTCPTLSAEALASCQITCCTADDACGVKNTEPRAVAIGLGDCNIPAVEDPTCPGITIGGMGGAFGCCLDSGFCGVAFMGSPCIDTSGFGSMTPQACDSGADAGAL